jgi:2-hydroxychromene-2-carboxylate isomerase
MSDAALDFWFDFASTYSYPAALRIRSHARQTGVSIEVLKGSEDR